MTTKEFRIEDGLIVNNNVDVYGTVNAAAVLVNGSPVAGASGISWSSVPASPITSGSAGSVAYDTNYFYVCVSNNTWKRTPLSTWTYTPTYRKNNLLVLLDAANTASYSGSGDTWYNLAKNLDTTYSVTSTNLAVAFVIANTSCFSGNGSSTLYDLSPNGNDGTLYNNTETVYDGYQLSFFPVSGPYISVPDSLSLHMNDEVTLDIWLSSDYLANTVYGAGFAMIASIENGGSWGEGFGMHIQDDNNLYFWINGYSTHYATCNLLSTANSTSLINFTGVYKQSEGVIKLYRDGVLVSNTSEPEAQYSDPITVTNTPLNIMDDGTGYNFNGGLYAIFLYNKAFTDTEVGNNFKNTIIQTDYVKNSYDAVLQNNVPFTGNSFVFSSNVWSTLERYYTDKAIDTFSLAIWMKGYNFPFNYQTLIDTPDDSILYYLHRIDAGNTGNAYQAIYNPDTEDYYTFDNVLAAQSSYMIAATHTINGGVKYYVNGSFVFEANNDSYGSSNYDYTTGSFNHFSFGGGLDDDENPGAGSNENFIGEISRVMVYDAQLTDQEVADLYTTFA